MGKKKRGPKPMNAKEFYLEHNGLIEEIRCNREDLRKVAHEYGCSIQYVYKILHDPRSGLKG